MTADGNHPMQSKFNLINDWPLPKTGTSLLSFVRELCVLQIILQ